MTNTTGLTPQPAAETSVPRSRFASWERVSTEDRQDPESSRAWQYARGKSLIEPHGGVIVVEFFDIDKSRSIPPQRGPEASKLLAALADPKIFGARRGSGRCPIGPVTARCLAGVRSPVSTAVMSGGVAWLSERGRQASSPPSRVCDW